MIKRNHNDAIPDQPTVETDLERELLARAEATLRQQNDYLTALHETALNIMNRLDVNDLLKTIIERAGSLIGTGDGYIYLLDEDGARMAVQIVAGDFFRHSLGHFIERGEGLAGRVWQTGLPLAVDDYSTWQGRSHRYDIYSILHATVGVPLKSGKEVVGVLGLIYKQAGFRFTNEEIVLLGQFAELASIALDNARLYTAMQQELAERKQTEEQLRLLSSAVRSSSEAIIITGAEPAGESGVLVLYANDAYYRMTGHTPEEIIGQPASVLRSATINTEVERHITAAMRGQQSVRFDTLNHKKDGTSFWAEFTFEPIKDESGQPIHWVAVMRDVTEHRQYEQQLLYLSTHDYLTDLPNRRALEERLAQVVVRTRSSEESALMFIDLDNFKEINDTTPLGHDAGDQALKFIAHLLNRRLRDDDMLARIGGDEFAVLLDRTTMKRAEQIANRLSAAVARETFSIAGHQFHISLSVGLVAISGQQSARTVLFQADTAMYIAKKQGGNRVIVYKSVD